MSIAAALFGEKGYDGTSLRDIAEAAGLTKAALYYHFPDKERLYEAVIVTRMTALTEAVCEAIEATDDPVGKIRAFMVESARRLDSNRAGWLVASNLFWTLDSKGRSGEAIRLRDGFESMLRGLIADAVAGGQVRDVDPATVGRLLLSGLNQLPRWHKPGGPLTAAQVMEQYFEIVLNGIAAR